MFLFRNQLLSDGQQYMQTWPLRRELYPLFPECRVISVTRFSIKAVPPLLVSILLIYYMFTGFEMINQMMLVGAFLVSLPMQGILWLGHRSNQPLPPSMRSWYFEIHQKMRSQGRAVERSNKPPRYKELARLLHRAYNEMDRAFTEQWF